MIRAIGTRYAGCFFRSRLEARWAVFFDVLDIDWEYEPDGFRLPSGAYLPDFRLPTMQCWVEVKPRMLTRPELVRAYELASATEAEGWRFLALEGDIPRSADDLPDEFFDYLLPNRFQRRRRHRGTPTRPPATRQRHHRRTREDHHPPPHPRPGLHQPRTPRQTQHGG